MANLRKDKTKKQGLTTRIQGRSDGLTGHGRVRSQDTGKPPGGVKPKNKQPRLLGTKNR